MNRQFSVQTKLIFFVFAILAIVMPQLKLHGLHTTYFDLGVFAHKIAFSDYFDATFQGHSFFYMPMLKLAYKIIGFNLPCTFLLLTQSVVIIIGCYVVMRSVNVGLFILFIIGFPLWYLLLFDFHFESLLVLFFPLFFKYTFENKYIKAGLCALAIGLIKEPYFLTMAACGICLIFRATEYKQGIDKVKIISGVFVFLLGILLFYISTKFLIINPHALNNNNDIAKSGFEWINYHGSIFSMSIFENINVAIENFLVEPKKILFLIALFVYFSFIPFRFLSITTIAIPTILIGVLSTNPLHYKINSHYYIAAYLPLFYTVACAISTKAQLLKSRYVFIIPLIVNLIISPAPFSFLFWSNYSWQYSYSAYNNIINGYHVDDEIKRMIMPADSVMIQNTFMSDFIANRENLKIFPYYSSSSEYLAGESPKWIILNLNSPLFIVDQSCDYRYGKCYNEKFVKQFYANLDALMNIYNLVFNKDGYQIYRRADDNSALVY